MSGADSAVEAAAYTALAAGVTLAPVYQHVPEDTAPPVVIIGDIDEDAEPFRAKGDDDDQQITLTIVSVIKGEARKPLSAIQAQVKAALSNLRIVQDGWSLSFVFLAKDGSLLEDGETYVGNSRFTVTAINTA